MIFVENELHHVNEADTETKGKSAPVRDTSNWERGADTSLKASQRARESHPGNAKGKGKGKGKGKPKSQAKPKSQPKTRKRQIEDLAIDDASLVPVDEEEEEGLLIQKI
jgi:hypothetical protein